MELILSLILLAILVLPPIFLAGRELLGEFFLDKVNSLFGKADESEDAHMNNANFESDVEKGPVYDGMITVEIPIDEPQVVAYEPPPHADAEIEIICRSSRA